MFIALICLGKRLRVLKILTGMVFRLVALLFIIVIALLVCVAYGSLVEYGSSVTPIVRLLELQLGSYYRPNFHGFLCFPSNLGPEFTDFYDYWSDDDGKVLTSSVIVGNYTMAYEAFNFLYSARTYGYMMPARFVQVVLHSFNGYYGNNIIAAGGCPLELGVELFGFNYVTSIESINGISGCGYRVVQGNEAYLMLFGSRAEVVLGNFNYFLIKPLNGNLLTVVFKPPAPLAYAYSSNLSLVRRLMGFGMVRGGVTGVVSFTSSAPFGNTALFILGNISEVELNSSGLIIKANGNVRVYVAGVTVDYGSVPYVMYGLLLGKYPSDTDVSTPASFGYIALGPVLLGLRTHNETVLSFARGFINFWLPIVKHEVNNGVFYPRSVSTFLIAALLLEPNNTSIRQLALSYVKSPITLSSVKGGATGYGLTAWLINVLNSMGYGLSGIMREYYQAQLNAFNRFRSMESPPLPIDYTVPYKAGEDLFGWLEAGLPYNDTGIALPLLNIIFNDIVSPWSNPPPFYVFFNYANTEGVPAILESIALWQAKMLNSTGLAINRWRYLNVTGLSIMDNSSLTVVSVKARLMPPNGIVAHLEFYIPFNPLNVSVYVNGRPIEHYLNQSMYMPTQYYLTYMPQMPSGWFLNKTTHMLYIQYIPTPTELFNYSMVNINVVILKPYTASLTWVSSSHPSKLSLTINAWVIVALMLVILLLVIILILKRRI